MKRFTKALAAIMLMVAVVCAAGCKKDNDGYDTYNGHEYVDLGLPSGTLWATCNVGADNPEDYGDYFAWGETEPKTIYNWTTYKWCNGNDDQLTKYCNSSRYGYNGFTDNLTTLGPGDDAATANWGSGWHIPTEEQWEELYQNTTSSWITRNGVKGRVFTASNGNSIFLPAAGNRRDSELEFVDCDGLYWSRSFDLDYPCSAWYLYFFSYYRDMNSDYRYNGFTVRPVLMEE